MNWYYAVLIILASCMFMELVAWFTHKYIMHGSLWILHRDHHIRDGRKIEWNDLFALIFAVPSILLIYYGTRGGVDYRLYIGAGIFLYGMLYFLFHDVLVHKRLRLFGEARGNYLKATVRAHMDHHKPRLQHNYGFLVAPFKYYREEFSGKTGG